MTLRRRIRSLLAEAGVPSPDFDTDELLAFVSGRPRGIAPRLDADQTVLVLELASRRAAREPLQHLTGRAPFRYLELQVGPGVFIPRPETEVLVDIALESPFTSAVDLCTGSAAIALSLATEAAARVVAVEADPAAVEWARRNIEQTGADVHLVQADVCADPLDEFGPVDLVVSNPPYIPEAMVPRDPEVALHDPPSALYGGADGMEVVRCVAGQSRRLLAPGGRVLIEHAEQQGPEVTAILTAAGFQRCRTWPDLTGRPRVTGAEQPA